MSLVNDILRELEEREAPAPPDGGDPLGGLCASRPAGHGWLLPVRWILVLSGVTGAVLALLAGMDLPLADGPASPDVEPPAVSARPPAVAPSATRPRADPIDPWLSDPTSPAPDRLAATTQLRRISLETTTRATRLGFALDREADYWIDGDPGEGELEIVMADTRLADALPPVDLDGSIIETLEARPSPVGLHVRIDLDEGVRVQSQLLATASGSRLLVDLEPARSVRPDRPDTRAAAAGAGRPSEPPAPRSSDAGASASGDRDRSDPGSEFLEIRPSRTPAAVRARRERDLAESVRRRAMELLDSGRPDEAEYELRRAMALVPDDTSLRILRARLLERSGRGDEAIALLEDRPPPIDAQPGYHALLAAIYQAQGRHAQSAQLYADVLRSSPRNPAWWIGLGVSLEGDERAGEALSAYQIARSVGALKPETESWLEGRIRTLARRGTTEGME